MYYETLILGLVMGCIYSVTALGVNIIYGIMQIVNWAHGSILMISMFIVYGAVVLLGMNPYLALILAVPIMFAFGYVFQHVVIRPLFLREKADSNPVGLLLCTAGLGIALENIMLMIFEIHTALDLHEYFAHLRSHRVRQKAQSGQDHRRRHCGGGGRHRLDLYE